MNRIWGCKVLLSLLVVSMPVLASANDDAGNLSAQYKEAVGKKEFDRAAVYICQAAKLDSHKYEKKCDSAQRYAADQLVQYESIFKTSRFELDHKDYAGAIRDLKKIHFGPRHDEAQQMIQEASRLLNPVPLPPNTDGRTLEAAQGAYENGDFVRAVKLISSIKDASVLAGTRQILTNIHIYNQSIEEGDAYMQSGDFATAKQKYRFALAIKSNGPGNPGDKLQRIASLLTAADNSKPQAAESKDKSDIQMVPDSTSTVARNNTKPSNKSSLDNSKRIREYLAKAHNSESNGDTKAAVLAYEQILAIDPKQEEALAGKQRLLDVKATDPQAVEEILIKGIHSFSQSHFEEARDALSLYLNEGGLLTGAAHFYLGATFMTQAILSDERDQGQYDDLEKKAVGNFHLAKQEHFKPQGRYVSPKIIAAWNRADP